MAEKCSRYENGYLKQCRLVNGRLTFRSGTPSDLYFSALVQLSLLILINPQIQNRQSHWSRIRHII